MSHEEFTIIFNKHHPHLCYLAKSMVGDIYYEDMVANAFVSFWNVYKDVGFISPDETEAILVTYTKNGCLNQILKSKRAKKHHKEIAIITESVDEEMEAKIIKAQYLNQIYQNIKYLPQGRRKIFDLLFIQGKSYEEAAEITGLKVDTLRTEKFRILEELKTNGKIIKDRGGPTGQLYEYQGMSKTLAEWARHTGIPYPTLKQRVYRLGWDIERALSSSNQDVRNTLREINYNGISKTLVEWAKTVGVSYITLYQRIIVSKWPIERALTTK